ncbi:hypothetical protein [Luteimonas sp. FCS-9]|uniref:XAC0095 family protein n=1 Tax=Luteimonas sp. FCS-9 TaxID=1547516 RepID=UPI00063E82CA|nr:hypothetical protein [Luteimonas sp. FCS-9]KLJ00827.1 hypothetical protein WQ56_08645 [Luteimonas sp. FCS-9]
MSNHETNDTQRAGYFVPEDDRTRLAKLRDHMEFLSRLAQPRTRDEELDDPPEVSHNELATCLAMLAEQAELVLEAMAWRPRSHWLAEADASAPAAEVAETPAAPDAPPYAAQAATASPSAGSADVPESYVFGVTIDQADALDRLVQTLMAHGDVLASGHEDDLADATVPTLGLAISEGADAVREILDRVQDQLIERAGKPRGGVREDTPVYGAVPPAPAPVRPALH